MRAPRSRSCSRGPRLGGAPPLARATRVDREERVASTDPAAARFFGRVYGAQRTFAAMELGRARAVITLARAVDLRADAPPDLIGRALAARVSPDGGLPVTGFRARLNPERHADAVQAWSAALADDARRDEAFDALVARVRVRVNNGRCEELSPILREATRVARLSLAQALAAQTLAAEAEALLSEATRGAREAPAALRVEYAAAERWLRSVPVRAELQQQASEQAALWLRGVLNAGADDADAVQESGCALP
ncbi:MAG: hypothetical protein U0325_17705 [Polyangiales bacterium]